MNRYVFWIGVLLLVVPFGFRIWDQKEQSNIVETYHQELKVTSKKTKDTIFSSAEEYNRILYKTGQMDGLRYAEELNLFQNGMMGSLEVPKISLKLPIYHGVEEEVLANGIGHLSESSLPVGGENTHCVLTGHRGLPEAQLFTRLDELNEGDVFCVNTCGKELWYQISNIQVIRPEEVDVLRIQQGKDLISLVTCTPYGINTHRLVVSGERMFKRELVSEDLKEKQISERDICALLIPGVCLVPLLFRKWKSLMKNRRV